MKGVKAPLILALAAGAALFHLYGAGIQPLTALVQRPVHLLFMALLGLLGVGTRLRSRESLAKPLISCSLTPSASMKVWRWTPT